MSNTDEAETSPPQDAAETTAKAAQSPTGSCEAVPPTNRKSGVKPTSLSILHSVNTALGKNIMTPDDLESEQAKFRETAERLGKDTSLLQPTDGKGPYMMGVFQATIQKQGYRLRKPKGFELRKGRFLKKLKEASHKTPMLLVVELLEPSPVYHAVALKKGKIIDPEGQTFYIDKFAKHYRRVAFHYLIEKLQPAVTPNTKHV